MARTYLFEWLKIDRAGGVEALLERGKPGLKEGAARGVEPKVWKVLHAKLKARKLCQCASGATLAG